MLAPVTDREIVTHGCPFCAGEVLLVGRRLKHAEPVCARYRQWIDEGKEQYRQARANGRAHELVDEADEAVFQAALAVIPIQDDDLDHTVAEGISDRAINADWGDLMREVAEVGLAYANAEQLERWAKALDLLDAPLLARQLRKEAEEKLRASNERTPPGA